MTDTITLPRSVVEQALDAMNLAYEGKCRLDTIPNATEALRAALEQEPDAWDNCRGERQCRIWCGNKHCVSHPAPQPPVVEQPKGEQEPVAWIEHEWSGSGLRHLHFERPAPTVRDEVVRPVWTPLYTSPQPKQAPLNEEEIHRLWDEIDGWFNFARAIERAHGIGGEA